MKRADLQEFWEEEQTRAARSKKAKHQRQKRLRDRFNRWLTEKAERIEANGNPAAAAEFRAFWQRFSRRGRGLPAKPGPPTREGE